MKNSRRFFSIIIVVTLFLVGCSGHPNSTVTNPEFSNPVTNEPNSTVTNPESSNPVTSEPNSTVTNPESSDPVTNELYEVLVYDFSDSIPSVKHETEYVFADYEKYKDAPIDDTVEIIINGTKYSGKYQGSEYIAYNIFPSYVYLTEEGVEFLIDETGMLTHYFWKDEPLQDTKKTKDECVMIARDFLAGYVDVDQYEIEVDDHPDGRELYEVKFYKKLGDFQTTDTAWVTVKADGSIYLYSSFMLGKVDKDAISAASVDLEKIRASVNERLNSIYKDVKDYYSRVEYDEKYVELTTLKDGSLGVIYTVDVRFIETRGEYEIWRSERISFVVLID